jgi:hypothetical protein
MKKPIKAATLIGPLPDKSGGFQSSMPVARSTKAKSNRPNLNHEDHAAIADC